MQPQWRSKLAYLAVGVMALRFIRATGQDLGEEIPPFRPPKPELPPTFWEQYGLWVVLAAVALLILGGVVWRWWATRPPPAPPTPAETARAALAALVVTLEKSESCEGKTPALCPTHRARQLRSNAPLPEELPDRVSAILRTYFVTVLNLPIPQLTHRELAGALRAHRVIGADLASKVGTLLEALDQQRFNPSSNATMPDAVRRAMELIAQTESALHPPPAAAAAPGQPVA